MRVLLNDQSVAPEVRAGVSSALIGIVERLTLLEKAGLAFQEWDKVPPEVQAQFAEQVKADIERQRAAQGSK